MTLSLVIPAYNEEKYIKKCLVSAFAQEEKFDEVILVDNNSTDKTLAIARQFPVRIIHESKQGMIQARNCGFDAAKGDIIGRCDADTHLSTDWAKRVKNDFEKNKIDALTGPFEFYDLKPKTSYYSKAYLEVMKPILNGNEVLAGPNMAISADMWKKVRNHVCLDNNLVHEDIDLAIHIIEQKGRIMKDEKLFAEVSSRRMRKNPASFFGEYPIRILKTLAYHKNDVLTPFFPWKP
jgi:glycosyltransferase involved in cell wall biosynthesis